MVVMRISELRVTLAALTNLLYDADILCCVNLPKGFVFVETGT